MSSERNAPPAGWLLLGALLLLPPLVQGGTPRLPVLAAELALAGLTAGWAVAWGRAPRRELRLGGADALLALLLFWSLSSTLFAPYYHEAERVVLPVLLVGSLSWYLAFHPSFSGLGAALAAVRVQSLLQALIVFWQRWGAGEPRPAGTFYNPNFLAGFLAAGLLLPLGEALFPPPAAGGGIRRPALRAAESSVLLLALLLTGSRGGLLAAAAGLAVLVGIRSWRLALGAAAGAAALLLAVPNPWTARLHDLSRTDPFAWTRLAIWKSAWAMMLDHPVVGVGLGQFEQAGTRYAFPVTSHWARYTRVAENAHCEYLQAGAELGVAGLALSVAIPLFLALAARRSWRDLPPASRGVVATLLAGLASIAAHSAVDFPLHTFPGGLLLVLFAAGVRVHGVTGPERTVELRFRRGYAAALVGLAALAAVAAVRPAAGFWYFLEAVGAPRDLFHEKWALEDAPRRQVPVAESVRLLARAASIDSSCAPYHRALGSRLFQQYLRGEAGDAALSRALFHLTYAAQLDPINFQYAVNQGQAMTALARRSPPGKGYLEQARGHYRRAAELAPFQFPVYESLGALEEELGDPAAAERSFRKAVAIEEYYLRGWFNLGTFYARAGRLAEARETFRTGARLSEQARALVPTTEAERELIALEPAVFYNELRKIEKMGTPGGAS
jgi:O-antigen ligase/Tfp pilus assembly protein PilF